MKLKNELISQYLTDIYKKSQGVRMLVVLTFTTYAPVNT